MEINILYGLICVSYVRKPFLLFIIYSDVAFIIMSLVTTVKLELPYRRKFSYSFYLNFCRRYQRSETQNPEGGLIYYCLGGHNQGRNVFRFGFYFHKDRQEIEHSKNYEKKDGILKLVQLSFCLGV